MFGMRQVKKLYDERVETVREIASRFNVTPPTIYRELEASVQQP
jgi:IS30 family transposase